MSTPNVDGNLSRWVSHIQQQHSGANATPASAAPFVRGTADEENTATGGGSGGVSTADELEDEFRRARQERLKRRSQLGGGGGGSSGGGGGSNVSGSSYSTTPVIAATAASETSSLSGEETLRKLLGERGITSPTVERSLSTASTPNIAQSPDMNSSKQAAASSTTTTVPSTGYEASPPKKSNALLDRYGGALGPTGVARAGTHDAPASLASFMGGKASGPRLGKLAGDGRNAPPEASQVDQSRHALPGMARMPPPSSPGRGGSTPLASFLEARAAASGQANNAQPSSYSPPKAMLANKTAVHSPANLQESYPAKSGVATSRSPVTRSAQESKLSDPIRSASPHREHTFRSDAATSPLKDGDVKEIRILSPNTSNAASDAISSTATETGTGALSPGTIVHSPTADALSRFPAPAPNSTVAPQESNASPAFLATRQSSNERLPTASLTRLRSKKMVEQRIREAQERGGSSSQESTSPDRSPAADVLTTSNKVPWSTGVSTVPQPQRYTPAASSRAAVPGRWQASTSPPAGLSHALPGLGAAVGGGAAPTRNLYAVKRKTPEEEAAAYAAPVRLPGMGGASSPFDTRNRAATTEAQREDRQEQPSTTLEPLAKGRAKPKRATTKSTATTTTAYATTPMKESNRDAEEFADRESFTSARQAFAGGQQAEETIKSAPTVNVHVDTARTERRKDSLPTPDSATRLVDSAAALEALVEGRTVKTPPPSVRASGPATHERYTGRSGTLKIARNRTASSKVDCSALLASFDSLQNRSNIAAAYKQITVSLEVVSVEANGSTRTLTSEDAATLYERETHIITHRFKESATSAVVSTRVYARAGRASRLVNGGRSTEAAKVMEVAQRYRVPAIDARQGREPVELVRALGGRLITREGHRGGDRDDDKAAASLFQVRGTRDCILVDQVDMLTVNLYSALSVVVSFMGDVFVWHGRGATTAIRQGAQHYGGRLRGGDKVKAAMSEYEEGNEDEFFWTCFDRKTPISDAWHHRFLPDLPEEQTTPHLFGLEQGKSSTKLVELAPFSALDVRRDGVFLLQLPMEAYVLVGPDARSQRHSIVAVIEAAVALSRHVSQQRGPQSMVMPVHVVVFPSIVPREVRSAFRYWHDEHLNGERWQRMQLRMNVWERREAQEQLERNEHNLADLDDDLFLPVGVGLDDIRGIDI